MKQKKDRDETIRKYENRYLHKRNDLMFIFKFVSPFIHNFGNINGGNHAIAMFITSKKSLIEMRKFYNDVLSRKNIFKLQKYFEDFLKS
jgi:hypothetical protein